MRWIVYFRAKNFWILTTNKCKLISFHAHVHLSLPSNIKLFPLEWIETLFPEYNKQWGCWKLHSGAESFWNNSYCCDLKQTISIKRMRTNLSEITTWCPLSCCDTSVSNQAIHCRNKRSHGIQGGIYFNNKII